MLWNTNKRHSFTNLFSLSSVSFGEPLLSSSSLSAILEIFFLFDPSPNISKTLTRPQSSVKPRMTLYNDFIYLFICLFICLLFIFLVIYLLIYFSFVLLSITFTPPLASLSSDKVISWKVGSLFLEESWGHLFRSGVSLPSFTEDIRESKIGRLFTSIRYSNLSYVLKIRGTNIFHLEIEGMLTCTWCHRQFWESWLNVSYCPFIYVPTNMTKNKRALLSLHVSELGGGVHVCI